jgi:hypothetical protein
VLLSVQISSVGLSYVQERRISTSAIPSSTDSWADDFNDGNYDDWTVTIGGYSAASNILRGTTTTWNYIEHPSTAANGTWSFDYNFYAGGDLAIWFIANGHWQSGDTTQAQSGYFVLFHPHDDAIELWMDPGDEGYNRVLLGSWSPPDFVKWWHVEITRDSDGLFTVFLDGVNRIQATDTTYNTSVFFGFLGYNHQEMDNVRVNMPDVTTTSTATTDTATTTTGTTTANVPAPLAPTTGLLIPLLLLLVGGLVIGGVVYARRRKPGTSPPTIPVKPPEPPTTPKPEPTPEETPSSSKTIERTVERVFLVVCPFCGAKNEQGITKCSNCQAKL